MQTLPSTVSSEIARTALIPIELFTIELPTTDSILSLRTINLVARDIDLHFNDTLYTAFPISHGLIRTGVDLAVDSVSIEVGIVDSMIINLMFRNDGLRNAKVTITTVFDGLLDDATNKVVSFEGYVSSAQVDEQKAVFEVVSKFEVQDIRLPRRTYYRERCAWAYKDATTCGYTGQLSTCDKTMEGTNGCRAHDNVLRFGGFPSIPQKRTIVI
jgi:lambda family phage minor tail protein L